MSEEQEKGVNKWDKPSEGDLFGREPFVETIVKTIQSSKEGFNLGISARWGEGKSSILHQLKPKLERLNYRVLTFEPWKYTQDQISIKRKFIIDIYSQLGKEYDETELYSSTEKEKDLKPEDYQTLFASRLGLFVRFSGTIAVIFLAVLLFFQWFTGIDINVTQIFLTNLFIPVLAGILPLVTRLTEVTIKQNTPKVESAEQFEQRFNAVIEDIVSAEKPPEKIIIFVDDLDRCNHTEVEQILTALFTFFNNKHCTYIITADHTVIRRYISKFLQLEDEVGDDGQVDIKKTNDTRQKEATEYLKKIFQINFIVPKITSDLLEAWVKGLLIASPIIVFKNPYAKDYLINLVLNNFQGNPRKIKHFIRTLTFQLEAIGEKISRLSDQNGDESKNLNKVKDSPELLAKILILQDRFPDFYEQMISEPKLLQRREEGEIAEDKDLQNLLAQEPKFFNSVTRPAEVKTIDPYYFLYFSGSTGFVETKVVDPAEVKALARSADFDGLTKIISGLTDEPRNAQVEFIKKEFDAPEIQLPEKVNVVRSLFHAVSLIEEPTLRMQKLKDIFDAKTKFAVEFSSLQSVDFGKFISFADIGLIDRLFSEDPFLKFPLQNQILKAFISKQTELGKGEVTNRFIQSIAEGIKRNDANLPTYIGLIKSLTSENLNGSDLTQESLLDIYKKVTDPLKQEVFDFILTLKDQLIPSRWQEFESIILNVIEVGSIAEAVAMIGTIPSKINKTNFDLSKLISPAQKRIISSNNTELEQWMNTLAHPTIRAEFTAKSLDKIWSSLVKVVGGEDVAKRSYVRGQLPNLISYAEDKSSLLKQIVQIVVTGVATESSQTLNTLQNMTDFWSSNTDLKKEFAGDLKTSAKSTKDKEIRDLMIKSSNELVPPLESKTKKDITPKQ
ncbi:MAG: P-loop NTPase fold protein [Candidatus Paceibacterota bacterium]|jgi:hypothetical protein